jgi:hypothetical protein
MRFSRLKVRSGPDVKETIMQPTHTPQRDLFKEDRQPLSIPALQRSALVGLISSLLAEAIAGGKNEPRTPTNETKEAVHEQDRA